MNEVKTREDALAFLHLLLEAGLLARGHVLLGTTFFLVRDLRRDAVGLHGVVDRLLPQNISPLPQHPFFVLGRPFFIHVRGLQLLF